MTTMMSENETIGTEVSLLASRIRVKWAHLETARSKTIETRRMLRSELESLDNGDVSIVAFGSLGRGEFTDGSDIDWTLLVNGAADPDHPLLRATISECIEKIVTKGPGRERVFGDLASSFDLVHYIGGEDDRNSNTTRRSLLLLEGVPLGRRETFDNVTRAVLRRYLLEDTKFKDGTARYRVPRFLLNDFARFWRTMAVDFAYKRKSRMGRGAPLRNIKLRLSRKLLFAAGLIACFGFELGWLSLPDEGADPNTVEPELVDALKTLIGKTPLDIVAMAFVLLLERSDSSAAVTGAARKVFDSYDTFVGRLADNEARTALEGLDSDSAAGDPAYEKLRACSHDFRDGLLELFFDLDNQLGALTRFYGVF